MLHDMLRSMFVSVAVLVGIVFVPTKEWSNVVLLVSLPITWFGVFWDNYWIKLHQAYVFGKKIVALWILYIFSLIFAMSNLVLWSQYIISGQRWFEFTLEFAKKT